MFDKKCFNCARKVEKNFIFCPYCGVNLHKEENRRKYGFLGIDDDVNSLNLGSLGLGGIFNSLMAELNKQMKVLDKEHLDSNVFRKGFSVNISSIVGKPVFNIRELGAKQEEKSKDIVPKTNLSEEKIKKIAKLPRKEARAEVRRLSNKIVYEIYLPGVKSMKDVIINRLENSIEIKAFSSEEFFFKTLPINLPVTNYKLDKDKLVLELKPKNI